jgi:hypothetical protein
MFELEQNLTYHPLRFHNSKQETLEEAAQSHLSKVADGKRTTGYADEDFIAGYMATAKKLHRRRNETVCKLLQRN